MRRLIWPRFSIGIVLLASTSALAQEPARVYRGATILTVAKGDLADADLVVQAGKIVAVGKRGEVAIPPGAEVVELTGKLIIPGLVDSHSHIGIGPRPDVAANQDVNEMTGPVQPGLRALDAIYPGDPGFLMALSGGVTTVNIMPGSGNAIGGQTLYVKIRGGQTVESLLFTPGKVEGGLKMANGENPKRAYGSKGLAPNTRMRLAALQREQFLKAREYRRKWQAFREAKAKGRTDVAEPDRDLALEPLLEVLDRARLVHFHSHRADDIMSVVRLADEFGFEVLIQHGTEAFKVADELAKRKIAVSMTLPDSPGGKAEVADLIDEAPGLLEKGGVKVAINTDDSVTESRFLLRTAAHAIRGGMSEASALRALTLTPAEAMHLEARVGSIEPGKDADFVVLSGAPFRVYTQVLQTFVEGKKRYDRNEQGQGNYAVGGFALADPAAKPIPPPPLVPGETPVKPLGGISELPKDVKRFAIRAAVMHTANGPPIRDGILLIEDGMIRAVGRAGDVPLPDGTPLLMAASVTPGLIDAHAVTGVSGFLNAPSDQDQDERSEPNQADARVLDAFNPREPLLDFALRHGVTVIQALPGRADVIAGQGGIFRTHGSTAEAMTIRFPSAMLFNLGEVPKSTYPGKAPSTRMGTAAMIRANLIAAANDRRKRLANPNGPIGDRLPKIEALELLLDGKITAIFSAHRADDLVTALRLSEEFGLRGVLDLATEGYLIPDRIAAAKIPVLVHPTMQKPGPMETFNTTLTNASALSNKGIPLAIVSAYEDYVPKQRVPLYEAAVAMTNGLGFDGALRSITLDPARILGIETRFGSLEPGKVADLVVFDGDPFEYTTHVTHVFLDGKLVHDRSEELKRPGRGLGWDGGGEMGCCLNHH